MSKSSERSAASQLQLQSGAASLPVRKYIYVFGFLLSLTMWFSVLCIWTVPLFLTRILQCVGSGFLPRDASLAITVIATAAYLLNSFRASILGYLWNLNAVEDVVAYIRRLQTTPPQLGFSCECYHMETRTRYVTEHYTEYQHEYDSSSKSSRSVPVTKTRQKLETYQERVVTFSESERFVFARWEDISEKLTDTIYQYQATRVDFSFTVDAGDRATQKRYNTVKQNFIARNQERDSSFEFSEHCRIEDFHPKMLSIVDLKKKSPLMHWSCYVVFTLCGLSWPYRIWFDRKTVYGAFMFRKRVFI